MAGGRREPAPTTANGPGNVGTPPGIGSGYLLVLDSTGHLVETWTGAATNGPWGMTSVTRGNSVYLFVTNVLNGTVVAGGKTVDGGTVLRIKVTIQPGQKPLVKSQTVIASGFAERTDPAALVVGPTGVAVDPDGTLYVADSLNNRLATVPNALSRKNTFGVPGGTTLSTASVLNDPLRMVLAPNGNILTVNGNNGLARRNVPRRSHGGHDHP